MILPDFCRWLFILPAEFCDNWCVVAGIEFSYSQMAVNVFAVADHYDNHKQFVVLDLINYAVVA